MSIIKRPGYSDRFDRSREHFGLGFSDEPRFLQSAELNEMQSMADDKLSRVADYILQDGRKMSGTDPVVTPIVGDDENVSVRLPLASVYVGGFVHDVAELIVSIPTTGSLTIGVRVTEETVDSVSDADLRGQIEGTEAYMEPGAIRVRMSAAWGHSADGDAEPLVAVYDVRDGVILTNSTQIDYSEIYNAIETYSRESNGSYVFNGFQVAALGPGVDGKQQFTMAEGAAYVNGRRIDRSQNMRFLIEEEPDLRPVSAEPHAFTEATGGTQTFTLSKSPIASVGDVTIIKDVTETIVHGGFSGAADTLANSSVESIIEIKQGGTTFASPVDWLLSSGEIDWSPGGAEPAPGSSYTVHYRYYENVAPDSVTRDSITVSGPANGTNVLVDYVYKLPRIDVVAMDMFGQVVYLKGVSAISRPRRPSISSTHLEIAQVINRWGIAPTLVQSATRNVPYSEITDMREAILDLYDLVAQERLKNDINAREVAAKRGVFVDPFIDDDLRDQGIAQTAAINVGKLRLPVAARVHEFPAFLGVHLLDSTDEILISQMRETGSMKINPYATFTPMPGRASLVPSTDIWTDTETVWPSATTARFDPPDRGPEGNNTTITSIELDTRIELIRSTTVAADFIRVRDVAYRLEGFIEGETLSGVYFDGIDVAPGADGPADANGVITGMFEVPANVPQGTKRVEFEGSNGTRASSTYIGSGEITIEEYRLAVALDGTTEELPRPVNEITVINQTTINNVAPNIDGVVRDAATFGGRGGGEAGSHGSDPLAQTFLLTEGRCVSAIRLKCTVRGAASNAIFVQIRTTSLGLPTGTILAEAFVSGTDLVEGEWFTARFAVPVYLEQGREYSFVVLTDDADHSMAVAEVGKIDQAGTVVAEQPFVVGVLLSSSNAVTWTVHNDRDLVFQVIGSRFEPLTKTVPIGAFTATKMSDIIVAAGVEYPENVVSVELALIRPNGEVIRAAPGQRIRLDEYVENETIQIAAELTGSERVTPFLYAGVQVIEGELAASADYVSRVMSAEDADRVTATFDALLLAGSSVAVEIGQPGDFVAVSVSSATQLGDGLIEQTYERTPYTPLDARARITLTGTPAARPEISSLRIVATEI